MEQTISLTPQSGAAALQLTPFEEQVMQVLREMFHPPYTSDMVYARGTAIFGYDWGGLAHPRKGYPASCTYPAINLALGRLERKGLVARRQWPQAERMGYAAGAWQLTNLACEILGVDPG